MDDSVGSAQSSVLGGRPASLEAVFAAAPPLELAQNRPLLLAANQNAWLITAGTVDLFAVHLADGRPAGSLHHLYRAQSGQALFGLGGQGAADGLALVARGHPGTTLQPCPLADLFRAAQIPAVVRALAALLDAWVEGLAAGLAPPTAPTKYAALAPEQGTLLKDREIARPAAGVLWVRHIEGQSWYLDRDDLPVLDRQAPAPLGEHTWLRALGPSKLLALPTETFLQAPDLAAGIAFFHRLVLATVTANIARGDTAERLWLARLAVTDQHVVGEALGKLSGVLADEEARIGPIRPGGDPIAAACRLVGDWLGIRIREPAGLPAARQHRDPVQNVARASRVRVRQVALRGEWWRKDGGPLVGFVGAENGAADHARPMALLPVPGPAYELCDTVAGTRRPVTADVAGTLSAFAYTFFRPLPARLSSARDLLAFGLRESRNDLGVVLFMGLLVGLLGTVTPLATGVIFDSVIPAGNRDALLGVAAALLVSALAVAGFTLVRGIAILRIETRASSAIQTGLWDRLLSLPVPFFRGYSAGDLASRAMGIDRMRSILAETTITAILAGVFSIFNFALLFYLDAGLALLATVLVLITAGATFWASYLQLGYERQLTRLQARLAGTVLQLITGISKLRVSGTESRAFALWAEKFATQRRLAFQARSIANRMAVFNAAFPVLSSLAIFAVVAMSGSGPRSTGSFLAFLAAFGTFLAAGLEMSSGILSILRIVPLFENARPILSARPEVDADKADPGELRGDIEVSHISFRYSPDGPAILQDVSIMARAGEFIAVVGPSGSGKSTLLRLWLGFEIPDSGSIYYDGQELAELDVPAVRGQIGVVLQSGRLMPGDIYTNIVGTSRLTLEDAWEAARGAGLDEDIRAMPMGIYTVVGEGATTFSGGQRQRLLIARAIVSKPRILLFDEATSALDNQTQAQVSKSLENLRATRIVIAHRLSTIINADRIYVMVGGRVAQSGSYQELIAQDGPFAELARRQLA